MARRASFRPIPDAFPIWTGTLRVRDPSDPAGFRRRHLERTLTYIRFLETNGLTTRKLLPDEVSLENLDPLAECRLLWGDLTPEGQTFVRDAEQPWLRGQDRGNATTDDRILDRRLKKLRGDGKKESR